MNVVCNNQKTTRTTISTSMPNIELVEKVLLYLAAKFAQKSAKSWKQTKPSTRQ
jgi:hypothetical protein